MCCLSSPHCLMICLYFPSYRVEWRARTADNKKLSRVVDFPWKRYNARPDDPEVLLLCTLVYVCACVCVYIYKSTRQLCMNHTLGKHTRTAQTFSRRRSSSATPIALIFSKCCRCGSKSFFDFGGFPSAALFFCTFWEPLHRNRKGSRKIVSTKKNSSPDCESNFIASVSRVFRPLGQSRTASQSRR